jgi:hypothetical protein
MPGARGHRNEDGPKEILGTITMDPKLKKRLEQRSRPLTDGSTMNRRSMILKAMGKGGGTEAPNVRRKQIMEGLGKGPKGARTLPAGLPPIRYPDPGGNGKPVRGAPLRQPGSPGVGQGVQPKLGAQLSNRVSNGAIGQGQAAKVAQQRRMLQKAFGPNWRKQVFGAGGARGISGPFAQDRIRNKRSQGLAQAKRKLY